MPSNQPPPASLTSSKSIPRAASLSPSCLTACEDIAATGKSIIIRPHREAPTRTSRRHPPAVSKQRSSLARHEAATALLARKIESFAWKGKPVESWVEKIQHVQLLPFGNVQLLLHWPCSNTQSPFIGRFGKRTGRHLFVSVNVFPSYWCPTTAVDTSITKQINRRLHLPALLNLPTASSPLTVEQPCPPPPAPRQAINKFRPQSFLPASPPLFVQHHRSNGEDDH